MASIQDGSQSPVTHSCPKSTVARAPVWFSICGSPRLSRCDSTLAARTTNSTACSKTGSSTDWLCQYSNRKSSWGDQQAGLLTLQMLGEDLCLIIYHSVNILGSSIYRPDDSEEPIKHISQVTSWPWKAIVWYLKRPGHLNILSTFSCITCINILDEFVVWSMQNSPFINLSAL